MNVGDIVTVKPTTEVGIDGQTYDVFCAHQSGRGWSSRGFYTGGAGVKLGDVQVQILPQPEWIRNIKGKKPTYVKLIVDVEQRLLKFKKKPYIRKDGSYTIADDYGIIKVGLKNQYCSNRLEHMWAEKYECGKSHAHMYYQHLIDAGFLSENEAAAVLYLYI